MIYSDAYYGLKYINKKEIKAVKRVLKSKGLFRYDGPIMLNLTDKLEQIISNEFSTNALCVDNGTSALKLCMVACEVGIGDEVLVPCLSFIASASSILSVGALPVFVDIDETFNIDISKAEKLITDKTKAIVVVHFQGQPCNMQKIMDFAQKHNLKVIEDVAQAFGTKYNNQLIGTFGDCASFSFQAGKVITSGEGGCFICKDKTAFETAKRYADCGGERLPESYPVWDKPYISFGENFKITELQSAILLEQYKKMPQIYKKQTELYNIFINNISGYNIRKPLNNTFFFPMSLCFIMESEEQATKLVDFMEKKEIEFGKKIGNFMPAYNTFVNKVSYQKNGFPYTKEYKVNKCQSSLKLLKKTVWFSLSAFLTKKEINKILKCLEEFKNV